DSREHDEARHKVQHRRAFRTDEAARPGRPEGPHLGRPNPQAYLSSLDGKRNAALRRRGLAPTRLVGHHGAKASLPRAMSLKLSWDAASLRKRQRARR